MSDPDLATEVRLAEMIQSLRAELLRATYEGKDSPLRFKLDKIELEVNISVSRSTKGDGEIRFSVISIGGSKATTKESIHVFKLTMTPESLSPLGDRTVRLSDDSTSGPE